MASKKKKKEDKPIKVVVSKDEWVTPAIADDWLKLGSFKYQRRINNAHRIAKCSQEF